MRKRVAQILAGLALTATVALGQNVEITPFVGGQHNGGLNLALGPFSSIDVKNGVNYGFSLGYLVGKHSGIEFMWNHNQTGTAGQLRGGGPSRELFNLSTNQFLGNFLYHFNNRQTVLRPFLMFGLGGSKLSPDNDSKSASRFVMALGGGVKYNFTKRFGVRLQGKWSPTYITTTNGGIWCDPFGCLPVGNAHFLNEFDVTAGLILRL